MSSPTIFGREPVAIVGAIQSLLVMAVSFGWLADIGLHSQNDVMLVVAVCSAVAALYLAWATKRTLLAPVVELFKALVAMAAIYGFTLTTEQTGTVIATITMVLALFHQSQTAPLAKGSFDLAA